MTGSVAPDIEAARYLFCVEDVGHLLVHLATDVVDAGGKDTGVATEIVKVMSVADVRHVVGGQVEVAVLIVVAGEEAGGIERATHREDSGKDLGVAKGDVDCMVTTKAASDGAEAGTAILVADEGYDLL